MSRKNAIMWHKLWYTWYIIWHTHESHNLYARNNPKVKDDAFIKDEQLINGRSRNKMTS